MPENVEDARQAFAEAAAAVLKRCVALAPTERQEQRWLAAWLPRVASYAKWDRPQAEPASGS